jgi:hypothetical protein
MERFKGDTPMNSQQRFDEVMTMLTYLDDEGILIDYQTRNRKRDDQLEWTVQLNGTLKHVATIRSTHAYLLGATDVARELNNTRDPLGRQ